MPVSGYFTFVLHSHIPYVREAGRWPFGEETLHEAIAETYIPLLSALYDLKAQGIEPKLTIGITPILLEQLADRDILQHFEGYLREKLELIRLDRQRHETAAAPHFAALARYYQDWYTGILDSFTQRFQRDLVGAFRRLMEAGTLDILTSAATHAYLPLMDRDSTIYGQLRTGLRASADRLGRPPRGVWLPECGYRPAYYKQGTSPLFKPGMETFLERLNLGYFFTDTAVIEGGALVGKVAGDAIGPYGSIPARRLVRVEISEPTEKTTFRPYYVGESRVAVYGRDERTGLQVWSAAHGYPGDFAYREFHRKDAVSGLQYWRVTDASGDLGRKEPYDPAVAARQVQIHADHFVHLVVERLLRYKATHAIPGIIVSAYDTELFGHWWFEGVAWIREVLRQLAHNPDVALTTAGEYLDLYPPEEAITLRESSWGAGGGHWTWSNPETEWMWPLIHAAEQRMEGLVARYPQADGEMQALLNQIARELVLLEASDWPFLITTGQARDYAIARFQGHLARFSRLAAIAEAGGPQSLAEREDVQNIMKADNPFPSIDYRDFAGKEGRV